MSPFDPKLFDELNEAPPAPPARVFTRSVHDRINHRLLAGQLLELATSGFGYVALELAKALTEFFRMSVTGKFSSRPNDGPGPAP